MVANIPNIKVMALAMMKTTMLVVTMIVVIAALVMIHCLDGTISALSVNALKVCCTM